MAVSSLGYIVVEATDLDRWRSFAVEFLGMMEAPSADPDVALFRIDDRPYRFWIQKGEQDRFVAPGWELPNKAAFDAAVVALKDAGRPVEHVDVLEARARQTYEIVRSSDPDGHAFELFHGRFVDYAPFSSTAGTSGFVTGDNGDMGMGHVVLTAPSFEAVHEFYKSVLGFKDTDLGRFYLQGGGREDPGVGFAFMHATNGRHHSLALGEMPESPNGAVHIMLEVKELADVGRAYDRALKSKGAIPISATLGQHVNDKMISFYVQTPGGFDLEYGWNGLVIDPQTWVPTTSMAVSAWGHKWAWEAED